MLVQTKPLYHAALSLAAYYRQSIYCQGTNDTSRRCLQVETLREKHVLVIRALRQLLQRLCLDGRKRDLVENIQVLCCMTMLISSEVSRVPHTMFLKLKFSIKLYIDSVASTWTSRNKSDKVVGLSKVVLSAAGLGPSAVAGMRNRVRADLQLAIRENDILQSLANAYSVKCELSDF